METIKDPRKAAIGSDGKYGALAHNIARQLPGCSLYDVWLGGDPPLHAGH